MASPYIMTNGDLQFSQVASTDFKIYVAFLNPVAITTTWNDLNIDAQGNWQPPPNLDTCSHKIQPYAPTANLGPNRIGFVGEPLYFDGSFSCQRHDIPVMNGSYVWTVTGGGSVTSYANNSQIGVTWSSSGLYTVSLSVKDRASTVTVGIRQVMVYANRLSALQGIITVSGLSGSLSSGGWQFQVTTVSSQITILNPDSLPPGQYLPVVLLCETSYEVQPNVWVQRTIGPHGLFNPGYPYLDPRILFDGYVQNGTVHDDADKDTLSFSCAGPQMILGEAKTHQLGYYACDYATYNKDVPTSLKPSNNGNGFMVGNLDSADVANSLLQYHCNIGKHHDIHIWNAAIPTQPYIFNNQPAIYNQIYSTLSTNEGTIWQNLQDLCTNEYSQIYCERDGSIRIGPLVNYRGADYWAQPTALGGSAAPFLMNFTQDLGYTYSGPLSGVTSSVPTIAAQPMPITFVHPWSHQQNPPQFLKPFGNPNTQIQQTQSTLLGPPILCTFSDTPIYDGASSPPDVVNIYPWITNNWPQDLSIYPISFDIQENYTGRASLVKLIGTLFGHTTLWSSWYPQNAFKLSGDGTTSLVVATLPASDWVVDESHVLPDITTSLNKQLVWNYWWEMARRQYYDHNENYVVTVTTNMFIGASLGDIVAVTRQNTTLGPKFNSKLFYIQQIDHNLDLTSRIWQTTFTLGEVTSNLLTAIAPPPVGVPKA